MTRPGPRILDHHRREGLKVDRPGNIRTCDGAVRDDASGGDDVPKRRTHARHRMPPPQFWPMIIGLLPVLAEFTGPPYRRSIEPDRAAALDQRPVPSAPDYRSSSFR
jgi:hypothetical protein